MFLCFMIQGNFNPITSMWLLARHSLCEDIFFSSVVARWKWVNIFNGRMCEACFSCSFWLISQVS